MISLNNGPCAQDGASAGAVLDASDPMHGYRLYLGQIQKSHRLLHDLIKDEFERLAINQVNAVQALILYNIAEDNFTAGELRSRGFYNGSNVSYNLKRLVDSGYMTHIRSEGDRREVRVGLSSNGMVIHKILDELFTRHIQEISGGGCGIDLASFHQLQAPLAALNGYWVKKIRYIY